jgi:hypothetical protein
MRDYSAAACGVCKRILDDKVDQLAGRCLIRWHPMKLVVAAKLDWDICPTPPRPPIPLGDEHAPGGQPALCAQRDLKLNGVYARVVGAGGLRGEVAVRRAWIEADGAAETSRRASLEVSGGRDGSPRRLVLSLGEGPVSPSEWTAEIQRRSARGKAPVVKVIDDVTGASWTADEITLEVEVPK